MSTKTKKRRLSPREILLRATNILQTGWCQGSLAKDKNDFSTSYIGKNAVCWCAQGAIYKVADRKTVPIEFLFNFLDKLVPIDDNGDVFDLVSFNDNSKTTKVRVVRLFKKATKLVAGKSWDELDLIRR